MKPRFFYLIPAESRYRLSAETRLEYVRRICFQRRKRLPCGGVKVIYQHCDLLNKNGFAAHPVHLGDFEVNWLQHSSTPLAYGEALRMISPQDILIVPERIPQAATAFPCRNKIAFVQNWGLVTKAVGEKSYEDFGFTGLFSCGEYVRDFLQARFSLPCFTVTNGIRLDLFKPDPQRRKKNSVLYLKRKPTWRMGRETVEMLPDHLKKEACVIELDNRYSEKEMAGFYQEADIFVATGFPEGFALPPLEAMACGCAVVGFSGGGGLEHMKDGETALVAQDGDVEALAIALRRVLEDNALKEKLRQGGLAKAQEFSMARMEKELVVFAEKMCSLAASSK
ncbi:MAG: glycosyltransferase family 4 protein [bacterium]